MLKTPPRRRAQRGQSAVETAITMPLFVFIILGLLQLGLAHQARLLTKYAAYKAARAGSIHSAKHSVMLNAALGVLVPFLARGGRQAELVYKASNASEFLDAWSEVKSGNQSTADGKPWATVTICNPTQEVFKGQDFDDPLEEPQTYAGGGASWKPASSTRLNVQVTLNYRMPIPFANGIIWWITHGEEDLETMRLLRMGTAQKEVGTGVNGARSITTFRSLAEQGKYILPIRNSWGMRMHSNFLTGGEYDLPTKNECKVPWQKK